MYLSDTYIIDLWLGLAEPDAKEHALSIARKGAALDNRDVYIQDQLGFAYLCAGLWDEAEAHMNALMAESDHHDVIMERFVDGIEMAVPIVPGIDGGPAMLPVMIYDGEDLRLRTYQEKRFRESNTEWRVCDDEALAERIRAEVRKIMPEIWPFDFGRFEFKFSPETGA